MSEQQQLTTQQRKKSLRTRGLLLLVQILLPFGLYFSLRWSNNLAAGLIAAGIFLSMIFLVWLG